MNSKITMETIYALATPPGRSGVAVIRASGPNAWAAARILTRKDLKARAPIMATLKTQDGQTIDHALILPFKSPASYTGEDVIEYHIHGGRAVIQSLLNALALARNHRLAEPGEFTRRAFENGKMDLTAAEAVADLIDAETEAQKTQALSQMEGSLSNLYGQWSEDLKNTLAHLEADIEFPDEDLPDKITNYAKTRINAIATEIATHLNDARRGERLRDGIQVAIIGAPNAGKSSLANALAQRDIAIVSDMAGTTRDVIEAHLDLGGYPVILSDTAGLNPKALSPVGRGLGEGQITHVSIESEGIRRAIARAKQADIKILLFDASESNPDEATLALKDENSLIVFNKSDLAKRASSIKGAIDISVQTKDGLDHLISALIEKIKTMLGKRDVPSLTRARHRKALEEALDCLTRAQSAALPELMAEDMRLSVRAIGRITGRVDVEDLLDVIFRDFCIGK